MLTCPIELLVTMSLISTHRCFCTNIQSNFMEIQYLLIALNRRRTTWKASHWHLPYNFPDRLAIWKSKFFSTNQGVAEHYDTHYRETFWEFCQHNLAQNNHLDLLEQLSWHSVWLHQLKTRQFCPDIILQTWKYMRWTCMTQFSKYTSKNWYGYGFQCAP